MGRIPPRHFIGALFLGLFAGVPCDAQARDDLTRALDGGVGRSLTAEPRRDSIRWTEIGRDSSRGVTTLAFPLSACWSGDRLVVADGKHQQLVLLSPEGVATATIGSKGTGPGQFADVSVVRCADGGKPALLTADLGLHRVSFFDSAGAFLRQTRTPDVPQIDILGDFALGRDGSWYDSWLGSDVTFGPYLTDEKWRAVRLVRRYGPDDQPRGEFGSPVWYQDRVARRVLNRVFLSTWGDTVWTLTQGDATIRGFTAAGAPVGTPIRMPVYFRGREPTVELGEGRAGSDFLPNSMTYDPNVLGLAVLSDSLFVTARYRDWGTKIMLGSGFSTRRMASSSIEIIDRRGRVLRALDAPGMVLEVASDGKARVAIISRARDNTRHVYVARVTP